MKLGFGKFLDGPFNATSFENALQKLTAAITSHWNAEHKEDGTHGDVTADTLTVGSDTADGSFAGNVTGSLVPTADGQDLGALIELKSGSSADHPWRHLRFSGTQTWTDFQDHGVLLLGYPELTRSGFNLSFASQGTYTWALTNGLDTHTVTFGRGLVGLSTNRSFSCASLSATGSVSGSQLTITDGITAPSASVGFAKIYVDTADGDLKVIFGDGTVKTLATDT